MEDDLIENLLAALPQRPIIDRSKSPPLKPRPLRTWKWPLTKSYNGFTSAERVRGWQMSRWLQDMGVLAKPLECSICGSIEGGSDHSENYYNIFSSPALCKGCHRLVHRRCDWTDSWKRTIANHGDGTRWFEKLPLARVDIAGYLTKRHGPGVRDLLASPLYELPDWLPLPASEFYPLED